MCIHLDSSYQVEINDSLFSMVVCTLVRITTLQVPLLIIQHAVATKAATTHVRDREPATRRTSTHVTDRTTAKVKVGAGHVPERTRARGRVNVAFR